MGHSRFFRRLVLTGEERSVYGDGADDTESPAEEHTAQCTEFVAALAAGEHPADGSEHNGHSQAQSEAAKSASRVRVNKMNDGPSKQVERERAEQEVGTQLTARASAI